MSKKIIFHNIYKELNREDFMFRSENVPIGDDLLRPLVQLKCESEKRGVRVATSATMDVEEADAIVFIDMPKKTDGFFRKALRANKALYLMVVESCLVNPQNYRFENHRFFKKIFTYDDSWLTDEKYFKLNYAFSFPDAIQLGSAAPKKLCTLIAGNKKSKHPMELYSKRLEAIRWFEQNHPDDFDLYGVGWDGFADGVIGKMLNKIPYVKGAISPDFPSYCGPVLRKKGILKNYTFSICYENIRDVPGYITEKIFDCFFSGCIPIYWGASNVTEHIPEKCFINKRNFKTYEELFETISALNLNEIDTYLKNINKFIHSDMSRQFSSKNFCNTLLDNI